MVVSSQEAFSVRVVREQPPNAAAVLIGMAGAAGGVAGALIGLAVTSGMDSAIAHSSDASSTERLENHVRGLDPEKILRDRLLQEFEKHQLFPSVISASAGDHDAVRKTGADGVLTLTIKHWGVRLCAPPGGGDKLQAGFLYNSRIVEVGKPQALWERDELYLDGDCYSLAELNSQGSLLQSILSRAIDNLSGKLVNEIRFP